MKAGRRFCFSKRFIELQVGNEALQRMFSKLKYEWYRECVLQGMESMHILRHIGTQAHNYEVNTVCSHKVQMQRTDTIQMYHP